MNQPPKSNLLKHLERNPYLREELIRVTNADEALSLNYRWEQKNGKERAYIELIVRNEQRNEHCIRLYYVDVTIDLSEVQQLMPEAARSVHAELQKLFAPERSNLTFQGYYLKGERQEHYFETIEINPPTPYFSKSKP